MNVFISGGCKNGKSYFAQTIAKKLSVEKKKPLYYIATMIPRDDEDRARIKRHISERDGWGFETLEQGKDLTEILERPDIDKSGVFLMDSVTALLSNEMFDDEGNFVAEAAEKVRRDVAAFAVGTGNTVFVSDYIYSETKEFDEFTEYYRKNLAEADRALAKVCDEVYEVSAGTALRWK